MFLKKIIIGLFVLIIAVLIVVGIVIKNKDDGLKKVELADTTLTPKTYMS